MAIIVSTRPSPIDRNGESTRDVPTLLAAALVLFAAGAVASIPSVAVPAFLALQRWTEAVPDAFWATWSVLGLGLSATLVAALVADENMGSVASMLWALVLGGLAVQIVKHTWPLPRPIAVMPADAVHVIGHRLRVGSMPSGHAAMIFALAVALARDRWRRQRWLAPMLLALGALGAVARVAVGAHWPGDILVGGGIGVLGVAAGVAVDRRTGLRSWLSTPAGRQLFAVVQLVGGVVLICSDTGYPSAALVQWALGVGSIVSALLHWRDASGGRATRA